MLREGEAEKQREKDREMPARQQREKEGEPVRRKA